MIDGWDIYILGCIMAFSAQVGALTVGLGHRHDSKVKSNLKKLGLYGSADAATIQIDEIEEPSTRVVLVGLFIFVCLSSFFSWAYFAWAGGAMLASKLHYEERSILVEPLRTCRWLLENRDLPKESVRDQVQILTKFLGNKDVTNFLAKLEQKKDDAA